MNEREQYWITYYDTYNRDKGYNLTVGGEGLLGYHLSNKQKINISKSVKKYYENNPQESKRRSMLQKEQYKNGRKVWCDGLTKETDKRLMKISASVSGENSPTKRYEVKKKISNKAKGKNNSQSIAIVQLNFDFTLVKVYSYIRQIIYDKFSVRIVSDCIKHKHYTKLGNNIYGKDKTEKYIWMKLDEYLQYLNDNNIELPELLIQFFEQNLDIKEKYYKQGVNV